MLVCDDVPVTVGYGGHVVELSAFSVLYRLHDDVYGHFLEEDLSVLSVLYPLRGDVYDYFLCDF